LRSEIPDLKFNSDQAAGSDGQLSELLKG